MMTEQEQLKAQMQDLGESNQEIDKEPPISEKLKELNFILDEIDTNLGALSSRLSPYSCGMVRVDSKKDKPEKRPHPELSEVEEFILEMIDKATNLQTKVLSLTENFRG